MTLTADNLLTQIKLSGTVPENQELMTAPKILALADEEIAGVIVPLLDSTNQEFFVTQENETVSAGKSLYKIPYRAIGRKLRDLKIDDGSGNVRSVTLVTLEESQIYKQSGSVAGFYFMADKIAVVPTPIASTEILQKFYNFRPSKLITTTNAGVVTGISGLTLTLSVVPMGFTPGYLVDLVGAKSGYQTLGYDIAVTGVAGNQVTLASVPTDLEVGDYICQAEKSPVIQLPDDCFTFLVKLTTKRVLESVGDYDGANNLKDSLKKLEIALLKIFQPRVEGASIKIINRNGLLGGPRSVKYYRGIVS
jgi:hypothetical protein